jgi:hypothetical protein
MSGKGDTQRPSSVSKDEYDKNFERTFGKPIVKDDDKDINGRKEKNQS